MAFNYEKIFEAAPCYALIKNLRYKNDEFDNPIEKGVLIATSINETELSRMIPEPPLTFKTIKQLKRFLYRCEQMDNIFGYQGDELLKMIDKDDVLLWDAIYKPGRRISEMVQLCIENEYFTEEMFYYDYTGTAYHYPNKIRDYLIFDEWYDILFFCGDNKEKLYLFFVDLIREKHSDGISLSSILNRISSDYFDRIASYNGEISGFEYWEYLNERLRNKPIPGITLKPGEYWEFADYFGEK